MISDLVCKQCGAPLPAPGADSPFVACPYCGATHAVTARPMELSPRSPGPSDCDRARADAIAAWDDATACAKDPAVAVRAVVAARSGSLESELEAERAARLTESLLRGFDAEHGTGTLRDRESALRLADAAVKAVVELRRTDRTDINLPFFAVAEAGPVHLLHALGKQDLADLDALGAVQVRRVEAPAAPHPVAPEAAPPPKKKWWPFGK